MIARKTVSLCMVVYNSSELTKRAIESVKNIVDEVVIVDQNSDEKNAEELKSLSSIYQVSNIYQHTTNKGNADYDRMYCYSLATKEYVLALDADEQVSVEALEAMTDLLKYDFDVMWFFFKNLVRYNDKEVNLEKILGNDPHPRLWKRLINVNGQFTSPIIWSHEAHQFPQILTGMQVFSEDVIIHSRELTNIIKTHLHRGKGINPQAQQQEKNFIRGLLNEFDFETKKKMNELFPELPHYLKG